MFFVLDYPILVLWQDRNSLALRLHYLARAKPMEDERTIKAQHVAPGTWFDPYLPRQYHITPAEGSVQYVPLHECVMLDSH